MGLACFHHQDFPIVRLLLLSWGTQENSKDKKRFVHPPSIPARRRWPPPGSNRAGPRHTNGLTYRCYLPVLTGFGDCPLRGTRPSAPHGRLLRTNPTDLGREFGPGIAGSGYRAPLAPHLARTAKPNSRRKIYDVPPTNAIDTACVGKAIILLLIL